MLALAGSPVAAQDWAKDMFTHTSHNFGTVARGAKAEHRFVLENIYEEDAHITAVSSSCGCTSPQATKRFLKTWEKWEIVATIDTRVFIGQKDATVTVEFDKPFPAKTQLQVHCYIRGDVVVQPEAARFGRVLQGVSAQQRLTVSYAGRTDWKIERVETRSPCLTAQATEVSRVAGKVTYDVTVALDATAPAGYLREELILVSNDLNPLTSRIPVSVEGVVAPGTGLTARPSPLTLGVVEPGQSVCKHLVIQGATPFHITGASCSDGRFRMVVPEAAMTVHLLPVTFTAGAAAEKVAEKLRIETDAPGGSSLEVAVQVQVQAAEQKPLTPAVSVPGAK